MERRTLLSAIALRVETDVSLWGGRDNPVDPTARHQFSVKKGRRS